MCSNRCKHETRLPIILRQFVFLRVVLSDMKKEGMNQEHHKRMGRNCKGGKQALIGRVMQKLRPTRVFLHKKGNDGAATCRPHLHPNLPAHVHRHYDFKCIAIHFVAEHTNNCHRASRKPPSFPLGSPFVAPLTCIIFNLCLHPLHFYSSSFHLSIHFPLEN